MFVSSDDPPVLGHTASVVLHQQKGSALRFHQLWWELWVSFGVSWPHWIQKSHSSFRKTTPTEKMGRLCCCWSCLHASVVCCGRVHAGCSRQQELQATTPFPESERSLAPSETAWWACSWKLSRELRYVRETFKHRSEFNLCPLFGPKIKQEEKIRTNCLT